MTENAQYDRPPREHRMTIREKSRAYGEQWIRKNYDSAGRSVNLWRKQGNAAASSDALSIRVYDSQYNGFTPMPFFEVLSLIDTEEKLLANKNEQVRITKNWYISSNMYYFILALLISSQM